MIFFAEFGKTNFGKTIVLGKNFGKKQNLVKQINETYSTNLGLLDVEKHDSLLETF